jgi:hypothetical protein
LSRSPPPLHLSHEEKRGNNRAQFEKVLKVKIKKIGKREKWKPSRHLYTV